MWVRRLSNIPKFVANYSYYGHLLYDLGDYLELGWRYSRLFEEFKDFEDCFFHLLAKTGTLHLSALVLPRSESTVMHFKPCISWLCEPSKILLVDDSRVS